MVLKNLVTNHISKKGTIRQRCSTYSYRNAIIGTTIEAIKGNNDAYYLQIDRNFAFCFYLNLMKIHAVGTYGFVKWNTSIVKSYQNFVRGLYPDVEDFMFSLDSNRSCGQKVLYIYVHVWKLFVIRSCSLSELQLVSAEHGVCWTT